MGQAVCRLRRVLECQSSEKLAVRHASAVVGFIPRVIISSSKVVRVHRVGGVTNSDVALLAIPEQIGRGTTEHVELVLRGRGPVHLVAEVRGGARAFRIVLANLE